MIVKELFRFRSQSYVISAEPPFFVVFNKNVLELDLNPTESHGIIRMREHGDGKA